jgi:hypothetical protein
VRAPRAGVQRHFPFLAALAGAHADQTGPVVNDTVGDDQPRSLAYPQTGLQQQFEKGVIAARQPVAALAGGPQQPLVLFLGQTFRLGALLAPHKLQRGRWIRAEELFLLRPPEELFECLDLAVHARRSQLLRPEEVLTVIDQIDDADPPQRGLAAAGFFHPIAEPPQVSPVAALRRFREIGGAQTAGEVPDQGLPQDRRFLAYYTHNQPPG